MSRELCHLFRVRRPLYSFNAHGLYDQRANSDNLNASYDDVTPGNLNFSASDSSTLISFDQWSSLTRAEAIATDAIDDHFKLFGGPKFIGHTSSLTSKNFDEEDDFLGTVDGVDTVSITSHNKPDGYADRYGGLFPRHAEHRLWIALGGWAAVGLHGNAASLDRHYDDNGSGVSPFSAGNVNSTSSAFGLAESVEPSPKISVAVTPNVDLSPGSTFIFLNGMDEPGDALMRRSAPTSGRAILLVEVGFRRGFVDRGSHG